MRFLRAVPLRHSWFCILLVIFSTIAGLTTKRIGLVAEASDRSVSTRLPVEGRPRLAPSFVQAYGRLPLAFEANAGQTDSQVQFTSHGRGYTLFMTATEMVLSLEGEPETTDSSHRLLRGKNIAFLHPAAPRREKAVVRMKLLAANGKPRIAGTEELPGKVNYFIGNDPKKWRTNVPTYAKVEYRDVYPGVNLVYYGHQGLLEHDFVVAPGADPTQIRFAVAGAEKIDLEPSGDLVLQAGGQELHLRKPVAYQEINGSRREIAGKYTLLPNGSREIRRVAPATSAREVAFNVGDYDETRPLVIDPVLVYSTYLGGSGSDLGLGIAVDSAGNAYVSGRTRSANFPTLNPAQASSRDLYDGFVAKLNASGSAMVYSTYIGGSGGDALQGVAVDSSGNAYVTGATQSTDFPTARAVQASYGGGSTDAVVVKLNAAGSALVYSTYLGGSGQDEGNDIAVDTAGTACVTGYTASSNFPTVGALQPSYGGGVSDGFVTKLSAGGPFIVYSTYLGRAGEERGNKIAVDPSGNAYVAGYTSSSNFPVVNAAQSTLRGSYNGFVAKLNAAGSGLVYSTYLGGNSIDGCYGIAVDSAGNAYVTGYTNSSNFPTVSPLQASIGGGYDAFATKLNASGSALVFSTFLGGSGFEQGQTSAVDSAGNMYVSGITGSSNFPTASLVQSVYGGGTSDVFVTKLNPTGSALIYSTFLGGSGDDPQGMMALDSSGNVYVAGYTASFNFPKVSPLQGTHGGGSEDAFIAKIGDAGPVAPPSLNLSVNQVITSNCPRLTFVASVTDSNGQPVSGLGASNFTLKEDGRTQSISVTSTGSSGASALSLALVIDRSGSVSGQPLADEKAAANALVSKLGASDSVAVYAFDTTVSALQGFTTNRSAVTAAINSITAGSTTALYTAVVKAAQAISLQTGRKAIVVMTDGENNEAGSLDDAVNQSKLAGAPVFTVGFGSANTSVLTGLATQTGGTYSASATSADLQAILQKIGQVVTTQYEVSYTTSSPSASHSIELTVQSGASQSAPATRTVSACTPPPTGAVTLKIEDTSAAPSSAVDVPVTLTATAVPASFQYDLSYDTSKLTFVQAGPGDQLRVANKDVQTNPLGSGQLRFLAAGLNQSPIANGTVVLMNFRLNSGFTSGSTALGCSNALAASPQSQSIPGATCQGGTLTVRAGCTCDVNGDGRVDVVDAQLIINQVLGLVSGVCDINGDGQTNVIDVQMVINAALGLGCK